MVDDLIPRPPSKDLPRRRRRTHAIGRILQEKCAMDNSRYQRFKEHVRELAVIYLSKPHALHKMQPSQEWKAFSSKVTSEYPEIARFYEHWPLILYFDEWVACVKKRNPQLRRPTLYLSMSGLQEETHTTPLANATVHASTRRPHTRTSVQKQVRQYVGEPPPKRRCRSLHSADASSSRVRERTAGDISQTILSRPERADGMQRNDVANQITVDQIPAKDLILRPLDRDLPLLGCRTRAIGEILKEKVAMESSRYEWLKAHVRHLAVLHLSSPYTTYKNQPSQEWEILSSKMTAVYPELLRFHECWPVTLYFNEWVSNIKNGTPHLRTAGSSSSMSDSQEGNLAALPAAPTTDQSQHTTVSTQRLAQAPVRMYVGKPPPKRRRSVHLVDGSPAPAVRATSPATLQEPLESTEAQMKVEATEIKMVNTSGSTALRGPQRSTETQIKAEVTEVKLFNTKGEIYRDHCIQCGNSPVIEDSNDHDRRALKDVLAAADLSNAAPALKAFGMYHDGHLHLLHVLKSTERRDVLKAIPNVPKTDAYVLINHLEKRASGRDSSNAIDMLCDAHRTSFLSENPVSQALESTLKSKGLESLVTVAALYGISDDRQLDRLLTFNESDLDEFFNTDHSTRASLFYQRLLRVVLKASELKK